jgi:hypothetical protein
MKRRVLLLLLCGAALSLSQVAAAAGARADAGSRIRFDNDRIDEVFRYATKNSPSFVDLVETLETLDRLVYVEEGHCGHSEERACLHILRARDARVLVIRIDPRQTLRSVTLQLAHELYHALEVAREPDVVDAVTLRDLYARIGERTCFGAAESCWETRAAVAFEALVARQLVKGAPRTAPTQALTAK